jgi:hypothetical protein
MNLAELIGLRPVPGAGLLVSVTGRCPLHCAHCSTAATMSAPEPDARHLLRFAGSLTARSRPDVLMLTGGEPLLRPGLVLDLTAAARRAGTRVAVLTGGFFARGGSLPPAVRRVIEAVDHFSVSIDAFHEREVSRADVFAVLRHVLGEGTAASLHVTGSGPADPYLAQLTAAVRAEFGDTVPMLVTTVKPVGRAAAWAAAGRWNPGPGRPLPCPMAAWPVVAPDGTVVACCNQDVVDRRPVPAHLDLGHVARDGWPAIRQRSLGSPVLRSVRTVGPVRLLARNSSRNGAAQPPAYCDACRQLSEHPAVIAAASRAAAGPAGAALDQAVAHLQAQAGPAALIRRYGCASYAHLVTPSPRHDHPAPPSSAPPSREDAA